MLIEASSGGVEAFRFASVSGPAPTRAQPSPGTEVAHPKQADLEALLDALVEADVEFIVVGGAAAVIHGAPVSTLDLDVIYSRSSKNIDRLMSLLEHLEARVRDPAGRDLTPHRSHLEASGPLLLTTVWGPLDPMATLGDGRGYEELLANSEIIGDPPLRVLDLETLVAVKAEANRAKDRLMLPILIALLEERDG